MPPFRQRPPHQGFFFFLESLGRGIDCAFGILKFLLCAFWKLIKGVFVVTGGLVVIGIIALFFFFRSVTDKELTHPLSPNTVVEIDLSGSLSENPEPASVLKVLGQWRLTLPDITELFQDMIQDTNVHGAILRLDHSELSLAQAEELRGLIKKFRQAGKRILAYAEDFQGQSSNAGMIRYYLACACDEIWMQPLGTVAIQGLILEVPFAKKAFEKVGVQSLLEKRKEYKNAPDSFSEEKFTGPSKESLHALLSSFMEEIRKALAQDRDLSPQTVQKLIDEAPWTDAEAKRQGLLDQLAYHDELENFFSEEENHAKPSMLTAVSYVQRKHLHRASQGIKKNIPSGLKEDPKKSSQNFPQDPMTLGVLYAQGDVIHDAKSDPSYKNQWRIGGHATAKALRTMGANPDLKAIIIRINTGGGSATASETIRREIELLRRKGVKVIVSMGSVAASGGYWIAHEADKIVAQPCTLTGSIGVYSGKFLTTDLWENLGIFWDEVHEGHNAVYESQTQDYTDQGKKQLNAQLDSIYEAFVRRVAKGRRLSLEHVREIAKGRVWSGSDALRYGLVDKLGGFETAVTLALESLDLPEDTPVEFLVYPKAQTVMEKLQSLYALDFDEGMRLWSQIQDFLFTVRYGHQKVSLKSGF